MGTYREGKSLSLPECMLPAEAEQGNALPSVPGLVLGISALLVVYLVPLFVFAVLCFLVLVISLFKMAPMLSA